MQTQTHATNQARPAPGVIRAAIRNASGQESTAPAETQKMETAMDGSTAIPSALKTHVHKEMNKVWSAYAGRGGILELEAKIAEKIESVSAIVYGIARKAYETTLGEGLSPDSQVRQAKARFKAALAEAEAYLHAEHPSDDDAEIVKKILSGSWSNYKSRSLKVIDSGLNLGEIDTLTAATAKLDEINRARATGEQTSTTQDAGLTEEQRKQVSTVRADVVKVAKESAKITAGLIALGNALKECDMEAHEDEILAVLDKAVKALAKFKKQEPEAQAA